MNKLPNNPKNDGENRDYIDALYQNASSKGTVSANNQVPPPPTLYDQLKAPLDTLLKSSKSVYSAGTELLHRINFSAIKIGEKNKDRILYRLQWHNLNSTRDLLAINARPTDLTIEQAILMGGINYEYQIDSIKAAAGNYVQQAQMKAAILQGAVLASTSRDEITEEDGQYQWNFLEGSETEVIAIQPELSTNLRQTELRTGFGASEPELRRLLGMPYNNLLLHLSTHGYFAPQPADVQAKGISNDEGFKKFQLAKSQHPLVRTGVVLAGANGVLNGEKIAGEVDGIWTGYEIAQNNLSKVPLVLIPNCHTGLGDLVSGEGAFSLPRAFKIAGTQYVIYGLWSVPDQQTKVFMTKFYKNWLGRTDRSVPAAFKETQKEMNDGLNTSFDPYQWASLMLLE
ncbi:MAG: CHAT domain-containing protein [Saprospiraceae bacterium]|nr:CHAT domain-containing protein [Saprospiraceae bacterium]